MTSLLEMTNADRTGAHSWGRKTLGIAMEGEQTNYIWDVIDIIPHKTFHGIQNSKRRRQSPSVHPAQRER